MDNFKKTNNIPLNFNNKKFSKESFIGSVIVLALNRDFFKTNKDVEKFISIVFRLTLAPYAVRSRTLMIAKISKVLANTDKNELDDIIKRCQDYIYDLTLNQLSLDLDTNQRSKTITSNKKTNMHKWISGILKKDK